MPLHIHVWGYDHQDFKILKRIQENVTLRKKKQKKKGQNVVRNGMSNIVQSNPCFDQNSWLLIIKKRIKHLTDKCMNKTYPKC